MGRSQIIGLFQAKYGEKILSAPTSEGFNLLAWVMPFGAVLAGCFIIVIAISRWRADQFAQAEALESSIDPDPELKRRLEEEIRQSR
jgi:cytochrome c-type biogenesis protein CcmH